VVASASTGGVTLSLPQSIATTSAVAFASVSATGDIVAYSGSDKRLKNNIVNISDAVTKVRKLNGVTWKWNDDVNEVTKTAPTTGLIAQEVQEVLPEVVNERKDGYLGIDYSKMVGLLVEAIKEQQNQIDSLTIEIENLKKNNSL
jgi:Chaperone of endosialidase